MFKQFSISHHRSSMKVGIDGVLIGCWTDVIGARRILDVGTGCGLIALIMAQRSPEAEVTGIDIDEASTEEALENVQNSPWSDRIHIIYGCFPTELNSSHDQSYDLIVSNPPYFDSGVSKITTSRERARHQDSLSPSSILYDSISMLSPYGSLAIVVPSDFTSSLEEEARNLGYSLMRKCLVRGHENAPYKRVLLQWKRGISDDFHEKNLFQEETLETKRGEPTEFYRNLCKDFYLKF